MIGAPPSVVPAFVPVPPGWFLALLVGFLFGPPIAGLVYGVRLDGPRGSDYVLAGWLSLVLVFLWMLETSMQGTLLGALLYLAIVVASVVVPVTHVYRRVDREGVCVLGLAVVYAPPLVILAYDSWVGI